MAKVRRASCVAGAIRAGEDLACQAAGLDHITCVLEHVAFCENLGARVDLEDVSAALVEVVVDGMEERVTSYLGGTAGRVKDIVPLQGHEIIGACEVQVPVVVAVTSGGPAGSPIDKVVANGHPVGRVASQHDMLATDERGLRVVSLHDPTAKHKSRRVRTVT